MGNLNKRCNELAQLLEVSTDSIFYKLYDEVTKRFVFYMVSEKKGRNSGIFWKEMIGKSDFDFLPFEKAQHCHTDDVGVMETGISIEDQEEELIRFDGSTAWVSVSKFPWKDSDGKVIGIIGTARDITQKKKEELHKSLMIALLSHDVKHMITNMAMNIKMIQIKLGKDKETAYRELPDSLDKIFQDMLQTEGIIGACLLESSLSIHKGDIIREEFDLRSIIDSILEQSSQLIKEKNIQEDFSMGAIPKGTITIKANEVSLLMVYRELFLNAIKNTPIGGRISFGFEDRGDHYRLNVFNTGEAIPPEKRESIFELFESRGGSTGIGLYACKKIVENYGGNMGYEYKDGHNIFFSLPKGR